MNYRLAVYMLGKIMMVVGGLMCIPMFISVGYKEDAMTTIGFAIAIAITLVFGAIGLVVRPKDDKLDIKPASGFAVCGLAWILISLIGAIPFSVGGHVPTYIDAIFETVSGFTTTGASIINDVEIMPHSILFWRSFTHWIGGMGILVLVIAVLPKNDKLSTALAKAEMPGPQFGKLVSKLRYTSLILYLIYFFMTMALAIALIAQRMPVFDSFCHAFATAATGGFSVKNAGIAFYNSVGIEITITVFMVLFSVNFNIYFMIIVGHALKAFKNEEFISMISIYLLCIILIATSLCVQNAPVYDSFAEALRYSSFQAASFMSTTGFVLADHSIWSAEAQGMLLLLMIIGGSAGSTAGGLKMSRVVVMAKYGANNIRKTASPRRIYTLKLDGKPLDESTVQGIMSYLFLYIAIMVVSTLLVSLDSHYGIWENLTGVISSLSNAGPAFGEIYAGNFSQYGLWAKVVFSFDMLLGRLEILPILLIFHPRVWRKA